MFDVYTRPEPTDAFNTEMEPSQEDLCEMEEIFAEMDQREWERIQEHEAQEEWNWHTLMSQ